MKKRSAVILFITIFIFATSLFVFIRIENKSQTENKSVISKRDVEKTIKEIYGALIDKNAEEYVKHINSKSLEHLSSNIEEIRKSVKEYLKDNKIVEYKIISIEDFNENIKTVTTLYKEISKDGHETEHDDIIFLSRNPQTKTIEIIYNGAISSKTFEQDEVNEGEYKFILNRTIELIDGVGVNVTFKNKSNNTISLGYGTIFANIILSTSDGESYSLPLNEVKIYKKNDVDNFDSFTFDTTEHITKVEIQGVFELNENGTPKEASPKNIIIYQGD